MPEDPATKSASPVAPAVPAGTMAAGTAAATGRPAGADGEEHLVRHRKRRRHRFRPESEALARHRQDMRALAWILPGCLLALGAAILAVEFRNPEPAARAKDVVAIGCALVGAGAVWLAVDLACRWIAVVRDWRRENETSGHRHHHRSA